MNSNDNSTAKIKDEKKEQIINDLKMELQEYKLTDRVQERLTKRASIVLAVFLGGVTFLGIIGGSYLIGNISQKVEKAVLKSINDDTEVLRKRLQDSLADFNIKASELKDVSNNAKKQIEEAQDNTQKLKQLSESSSALYAEVSSIQEELEKTSMKITKTAKETESLKEEIIKSTSGEPAIFTYWTKLIEKRILSYSIKGVNFGNSPKNVISTIVKDRKSNRIIFNQPVDNKNIKVWVNNQIEWKLNLQPLIGEIKEVEIEVMVNWSETNKWIRKTIITF